MLFSPFFFLKETLALAFRLLNRELEQEGPNFCVSLLWGPLCKQGALCKCRQGCCPQRRSRSGEPLCCPGNLGAQVWSTHSLQV